MLRWRGRSLVACVVGGVVAGVCLTGGVGVVGGAFAAPQPDPVPRRWEMEVEPGALRSTVVQVEEVGAFPVFYMTYGVANLTDRELYLAPLWELATDEGDIVRSGRGVPAEVYRKLLARLKSPLLEDEVSIQGVLRQGRENSKQGLVVWTMPDVDMDEVVVYGAGFSGETRAIIRPDTGEEVVLRKSLMLRHPVPGELDPSLDPALRRSERRWILR